MNQTQNYKLNQWSKSDRVLMDDFNADNAKIDGALDDLSKRTASLEYSMGIKGHASAYTYTYTGMGYSKCALPFNHRPVMVFLAAQDGSLPVVMGFYGCAATTSSDVTFHDWPTSGGLTGFTGLKYNEKGKKYVAIGILDNIY